MLLLLDAAGEAGVAEDGVEVDEAGELHNVLRVSSHHEPAIFVPTNGIGATSVPVQTRPMRPSRRSRRETSRRGIKCLCHSSPSKQCK
jgi:hypothetical protein